MQSQRSEILGPGPDASLDDERETRLLDLRAGQGVVHAQTKTGGSSDWRRRKPPSKGRSTRTVRKPCRSSTPATALVFAMPTIDASVSTDVLSVDGVTISVSCKTKVTSAGSR